MDLWHEVSENPHKDVAGGAEDCGEDEYFEGGFVALGFVVAAPGYFFDGVEGYAEGCEEDDVVDNGVLEVYDADAFGLQHSRCVWEGDDRKEQ